jgi:hypothetical protein
MRVIVLTILAIVTGMLGCAGGEWARVRAEDSPSAYRRFLREHPESQHAAQARERLDYLQLSKHPDPAAFERFRASHPSSIYLAELKGLVEEPMFEAALRQGTQEAFQRFLEQFPSGHFARRAKGNAAYHAMGGPFASPQQLAEFENLHPDSDYAEEARRTLAALSLRESTRIRATGLRIEIDPSTPGRDRLTTRFHDLALETYGAAGLILTYAPSGVLPGPVDAWLTIRHNEAAVATEVSDGAVARPGLLATTDVTLTTPSGEPFWAETFTFRTSELDRRAGTSVLFSSRSKTYWSNFFVPIATWRTDAARRPPLGLSADPVAVDVRGVRAATLFSDGSFQLLNLSDPAQPQVIFDHTRSRSLQRFSGVRLAGDGVVLFGEDGLEIVALGGADGSVSRFLDRSEIGSIAGVELHGGNLLVASTRGLLRVSLSSGAVESLLSKRVRDLSLDGDQLTLIDEQLLYVTDLSRLSEGRADGQFRLGKGFEPSGVRSRGSIGVVLSPRGLVILDLSELGQPRKLSWLRPSQTGRIHDAVILGERIFLLGERGLQILDPHSGRIVDSVDVKTRSRVAATGRFLVTVGSNGLGVVDATPWTASSRLAAPAE